MMQQDNNIKNKTTQDEDSTTRRQHQVEDNTR